MGDFRKTRSNWSRPSINQMTATSPRRTRSPRPTDPNYHPRAPWEEKSDEVRAEHAYNETIKDIKVEHPWELRSMDLREMDEQKEYAKNYKYESMFEPLPIPKHQQDMIDHYQMNPPFLCEYNGIDEAKKSAKKLNPDRKNPKTKSPWEYGAMPADPVRRPIHERPKTALWNVEPPKGDQSNNQSDLPSSGDPILDHLRQELRQRGAGTMIGLSKKFRIMDDDESGTLSYQEFRKGMKECGLTDFTERALKHLFLYFDRDDSGVISYDEFLIGIRGVMNERRKSMVAMAFRVLDKDRSGIVDINDIQGVYNASMHPDVIAGKLTEKEALQQFLNSFEANSHAKSLTKGDGFISLEEFEEYYSSLSASIDSDDYFELMIRNAWHISGGTNAMCSNTTNRRVLVTLADGTQRVQEVENDIGISAKDTKAIFNKLQASNQNQNGPGIVTMNMNGQEGMNNQIANPYLAAQVKSLSAANGSIGNGSRQGSTQSLASVPGINSRPVVPTLALNGSAPNAVGPNSGPSSRRPSSSSGSQRQQIPTQVQPPYAGAGNVGANGSGIRPNSDVNKPVPLSKLFANQATNSAASATSYSGRR